MYIHNLDPVFFRILQFEFRWYSLAYIFGILFGWWYGKKIISYLNNNQSQNISANIFDDLVTYIIIGIIFGGRLGYVIFYNLKYYLSNPFDIFKIWEGGMSFHGGLIGIILSILYLARKKEVSSLIFLDIVAVVAPIGLFLGRIANFINGELYGRPTDLTFGVIYPMVDSLPRHPSQLYQAILEGALLFFILNLILFRKKYVKGLISSLFLIIYGIFRIFSEQFREPDDHIGYIFNVLSMGSILSLIMITVGSIIYVRINNERS